MGLFMNTHPLFDGDRFDLWKARFESFIKANYFEICDILFITTLSFKDRIVNKLDVGWTKEVMRKVKILFKVKLILINALSFNEFYYVFTYESSKEV